MLLAVLIYNEGRVEAFANPMMAMLAVPWDTLIHNEGPVQSFAHPVTLMMSMLGFAAINRSAAYAGRALASLVFIEHCERLPTSLVGLASDGYRHARYASFDKTLFELSYVIQFKSSPPCGEPHFRFVLVIFEIFGNSLS